VQPRRAAARRARPRVSTACRSRIVLDLPRALPRAQQRPAGSDVRPARRAPAVPGAAALAAPPQARGLPARLRAVAPRGRGRRDRAQPLWNNRGTSTVRSTSSATSTAAATSSRRSCELGYAGRGTGRRDASRRAARRSSSATWSTAGPTRRRAAARDGMVERARALRARQPRHEAACASCAGRTCRSRTARRVARAARAASRRVQQRSPRSSTTS
jgi:hypothetical protein